MKQWNKCLFIILIFVSLSQEYKHLKSLSSLWRKYLSSRKANKKETDLKRQDISTSIIGPINATEQATLQPTTSTTTIKDQHAFVHEPVDVFPVQTVPPQQFISTQVPPTTQHDQSSSNLGESNKTHLILPMLPVHNVSASNQDVKPVIPVNHVPEQDKVNTEVNPIEPLPVITRPTVTVLQHVVGTGPTQATLQSVVVPKRKHVSPLPPLTPLPVIEPHTVATPMRILKPLEPIPPHEPHIIHHKPIVIPKGCDNSDPCGNSCGTGSSCSGK